MTNAEHNDAELLCLVDELQQGLEQLAKTGVSEEMFSRITLVACEIRSRIHQKQPFPLPSQIVADLHEVLVLLADTLRCVNVVLSTAVKEAIEKGKL